MADSDHQTPIRVLIADDHAVVREGLRTLFETEPGMTVVGDAQDGAAASWLANALPHDVILLDMVLPGKSGLAVIEAIRQGNPDARILVLTSFADDEIVYPAIRAGALGYLLRNASPQRLDVDGAREGGPRPPARRCVENAASSTR